MIRTSVLVVSALAAVVLACGSKDRNAAPASTGSGAATTAGSSATGSAVSSATDSAGSAVATGVTDAAVAGADPRAAYDCEMDDQNVAEGLHDRQKAVHHYTQYLRLNPQGPFAPQVRAWLGGRR